MCAEYRETHLAKKNNRNHKNQIVVETRGRPPDLDPEKLKVLLSILRGGTSMEIAATVAGMSSQRIKEYVLEARRDPDSIYSEWAREIFKALATSEVRDLAVIDYAAQGRAAEFKQIAQLDSKGDPILGPDGKPIMTVQLDGEGRPIVLRGEIRSSWQAAAWKLERRAPKRWGRLDRIQIDDMEELLKTPRSEQEKVNAGDVEARAKALHRVKKVFDAVPLDTDLGDV